MDLKIKYWDPRWEMLHSTDGVPYKENKQTLAGLRLTNTDDEALVSSGNTHKCTYQCWLWDATWMQAIRGAIYVEWGCPQRWHSCFKSNIYFTLCQGSVPPFRAFTCVASGKNLQAPIGWMRYGWAAKRILETWIGLSYSDVYCSMLTRCQQASQLSVGSIYLMWAQSCISSKYFFPRKKKQKQISLYGERCWNRVCHWNRKQQCFPPAAEPQSAWADWANKAVVSCCV